MRFQDIVMVAATQPVVAAGGASYGPELLVNGNMSSDVGWSLSGDNPPVIGGGVMTFTGSVGGDAGSANQTPSLSVATYHLVYTIVSISGTGAIVAPSVGGTAATTRTTAGTFTQDLPSDGTDDFTLTFFMDANDGSIVIDNASLKQVL